MINLLPPELKQEYRYARYNRQLLYWSFYFCFAILGVALIAGAGLFAMTRSSDRYATHIKTIQSQLARENISSTKQQVTAISNNLKLMVNVLSREILFSKLLAQLGSITPSNVILTNLTIAPNVSAIDITAQTSGYNVATQLQVNLADPNNQIFTKADILSISCATSATAINPNYPCTADIRAQFAASNPFLFTNSQKAGS